MCRKVFCLTCRRKDGRSKAVPIVVPGPQPRAGDAKPLPFAGATSVELAEMVSLVESIPTVVDMHCFASYQGAWSGGGLLWSVT